jgi:hypothetical protein
MKYINTILFLLLLNSCTGEEIASDGADAFGSLLGILMIIGFILMIFKAINKKK